MHFKVNKEAHITPTYKREESLKSLFGLDDKTSTFGGVSLPLGCNETCLSSVLTPFLQPSLVPHVASTHISLSIFHGIEEYPAVFRGKIHKHYFSEALAWGGGR